MAATNIEVLKFNLQERQYPYFDEEELNLLLETNDNSVNKASWKGCLLKSTADDGVSLGPLKTESNREYWLGLAKEYESDFRNEGTVITTGGYKTRMKRADGQ